MSFAVSLLEVHIRRAIGDIERDRARGFDEESTLMRNAARVSFYFIFFSPSILIRMEFSNISSAFV